MNARLKPVIAAMDDPTRSATRQAVGDALAPFRRDDGSFDLPAQTLVIAAR